MVWRIIRGVPWGCQGSGSAGGVTSPCRCVHPGLFGEECRDRGQDGASNGVGGGGLAPDQQPHRGGVAFGEVGDRAQHRPVDLVGPNGCFGQRGDRRLGFRKFESSGVQETDHGGVGGVRVAEFDTSNRRLLDAGAFRESALAEATLLACIPDQLSRLGHVDSVHASRCVRRSRNHRSPHVAARPQFQQYLQPGRHVVQLVNVVRSTYPKPGPPANE